MWTTSITRKSEGRIIAEKEIVKRKPTTIRSSVDNSEEIIRTVFSAPETYAVCLKEDNRAIGSIGLMIGARSDKEIPDTEGEIGYWIGVPFWGKGLIPEAVRELVRHGFEDSKLDKIWCGYFDGNEKSKRVQEKCGFIAVPVQRR